MSLSPGTRLGPYEIVAPIGAGGMGEVYRARDTKLNRDVAIKVLPAVFANDRDRLARFTREAQTLASLNHPNIAQIYGIESNALVMELVEGDDLSILIARSAGPKGPALQFTNGAPGLQARGIPVSDALAIAKQIADALEAAHELGIVHRDLKPANIKVRADGTVKVLDFGLAKAMQPTHASDAADGLANSPTLTSPAMTEMGMILGTAAYMSPEQARGKSVDKRADVWAFGVVVYEILTGARLFAGGNTTDVLAAVLRQDIDWAALPVDTPPRLRRLLERCLDRDPKSRLRDIGEARVEIAKIHSGAPEVTTIGGARSSPPAPLWRRALPWAVAAVALAVALVSIGLWSPWRSPPAPTPRKLLALIGADASLATRNAASAILSPDGTTLAFVARQAGVSRLFVRKLDQLQAAPLAGTEGAIDPFFSPDGQRIAFFADGKLKKVPATGGASVSVCDGANDRGGTWADDETIVFTPSHGGVLMRVAASGGTPVAFVPLNAGATRQRWPQALPRGKGVLYTEHSSPDGNDDANLVIAPMSGAAGKIVVRGGYYGRYVASAAFGKDGAQGHLIYLHQGALLAVRFDLDRVDAIGEAVPVLDDVSGNPDIGSAQLALSSEGTLVYVPGSSLAVRSPMNWLARDGKASVLRAATANWANPTFSPDGQKLAFDIGDGKERDVWVYDWARDTMTRVTFDPAQDFGPVWTPDSRHIVFASDRATLGIANLYWVNADGTGDVTRLTNSPYPEHAYSWHPTGKFLAFHEERGGAGTTRFDLMILPMEGDAARGWTPGAPTVFLSTPAQEENPMFSPDGRWIAYQSSEAPPVFSVYVRPFPVAEGKWRVSPGAALLPQWSVTTHELLFWSGPLQAAPYAVVGDTFRADKPHVWSPTIFPMAKNYEHSTYALHPDGKRVAFGAALDQGPGVVQDKVVFIFNFVEYLRRIAPGNK